MAIINIAVDYLKRVSWRVNSYLIYLTKNYSAGWSRASFEGACSGENGGETVWKDTKLKGKLTDYQRKNLQP